MSFVFFGCDNGQMSEVVSSKSLTREVYQTPYSATEKMEMTVKNPSYELVSLNDTVANIKWGVDIINKSDLMADIVLIGEFVDENRNVIAIDSRDFVVQNDGEEGNYTSTIEVKKEDAIKIRGLRVKGEIKK